MKYMGSKRAMLRNGLGDLLLREAGTHRRFLDFFSGSGAVATFIATQVSVPVHAYDLQQYGRVLAASVIERTGATEYRNLWKDWRARAGRRFLSYLASGTPVPLVDPISVQAVHAARKWCACREEPLTKAYGGHYFSPLQSLWLDAMRSTIGEDSPFSTLALAALLDAASECAASPGHTAQPFQPTTTAKRYISNAWSRDVLEITKEALKKLSKLHAKKLGHAHVKDANDAATEVRPGDLVFLDPPYSALQYSRFYHVLESVVSGDPGPVDGVGRYPQAEFRPKSAYSVKSQAAKSMGELLLELSAHKASVVLTFPDHNCSNGLSGDLIKALSAQYFEISEVSIRSRLSTLGGTGVDCIASETRGARRDTSELILLLTPFK
jgi:adenine-specific DNA-methyltransferase